MKWVSPLWVRRMTPDTRAAFVRNVTPGVDWERKLSSDKCGFVCPDCRHSWDTVIGTAIFNNFACLLCSRKRSQAALKQFFAADPTLCRRLDADCKRHMVNILTGWTVRTDLHPSAKADVAVSRDGAQYLGLQLKTAVKWTDGKYASISSLHKDYTGLVVIFYVQADLGTDQPYLVLDPAVVQDAAQRQLTNINRSRKGYAKLGAWCSAADLSAQLDLALQHTAYAKKPSEDWALAGSKTALTEQRMDAAWLPRCPVPHRRARDANGIEMDNLSHDLEMCVETTWVRIQNKVASNLPKSAGYISVLSKSAGNKKRCYTRADNDAYQIFMPDGLKMYFIPAAAFPAQAFDATKGGYGLTMYPSSATHWTTPFLVDTQAPDWQTKYTQLIHSIPK